MPVKKFYEYIEEKTSKKFSLDEYAISPATAFLKFLVDAKNASIHCSNSFKKANGDYTPAARISMEIINAGLLASIMGNFETYQKYLFGYMFEYSVYVNNVNVEDILKKCNSSIDVNRFSSYRDNPAAVGLIIADNMKSWHSPTDVNMYFRSFNLRDQNGKIPDMFPSDVIEDLKTLWQMRHSIVHTASTITIPDSQKVIQLSSLGGKFIALQPQFINEVARKLHPIIKKATDTQCNCFTNNLRPNLNAEIRGRIDRLFEVKSSIPNWLL